MQMNLEELFNLINRQPKTVLKDLSQLDYYGLIQNLRDLLNISVQDQISLKVDDLLRLFRERLFEFGVYVFEAPFHYEEISGFCIYDNNYPVIFLNDSLPKSRQLFTLFRKLYHLIKKTNSIDDLDYSIEKNNIELECDKFAAEFLIPEEECLKKIEDIDLTYESIRDLANRFCVSFEAMLIRLISLNLLDWSWYNNYKKQMQSDNFPKKSKKSGGNIHNSRISYLGRNYIELAYEAFDSNAIDTLELCNYLGLRASNLEKFTENWRSLLEDFR